MSQNYIGHLNLNDTQPTYMLDALKEQAQKPAPLIENSYYVHTPEYSTFFCTGLTWYFPQMKTVLNQDFYKRLDHEHQGVVNCAVINLSRLADRYVKQPKIIYNLVHDFFDQTGNICTVVNHKTLNTPDKENILLACCRFEDLTGNQATTEQSRKLKSDFFSYAWHKNIITEKNLYQSNAVLGVQHFQILNQKDNLDRTGQFTI